jgi:hypothetical protein
MKTKQTAEFIFRTPKKEYSKDLQKMFDYLRYKKATASSKATQKGIDVVIESVRKNRKEKIEASLYL